MDLAREALVDLVGMYCMAFCPDKEVTMEPRYMHRPGPKKQKHLSALDSARLCQEPMVAVYRSHMGGEWIPLCANHKPQSDYRTPNGPDRVELAGIVNRRLRLAPTG